MPKTVAGLFADTLAAIGVKRVCGIVGDSLNGISDSNRRQGKIEWLHVRHGGPVLVDAVVNRSELAMPPSVNLETAKWFHGFQSVALRRMAMEITAVPSSRLRLPSSVGRTSASIVQLP